MATLFDARQRADLALLLVTLFWGLTFPLIRGALAELSAWDFVALRFALAAVAFLPLVLASRRARAGVARALLPGLLLGVIAWSSYLSQTLGLQTVPAGRAAFITGTSVVLVPLLSPFFGAGRPGRVDIGAALLATAGLWLLCDPSGAGLGAGDLWILGCAASYAIYIHALQIVLRRGPQEMALAATQVLGIAACGWLALPLAGGGWPEAPGPVAWRALAFCALLATVGTFWLQTRYQGRTTPERVALIFAAEPVFAAIFAWWLLGEQLGPLALAGAALILVAVLAAELLGRPGAEPTAPQVEGQRPG